MWVHMHLDVGARVCVGINTPSSLSGYLYMCTYVCTHAQKCWRIHTHAHTYTGRASCVYKCAYAFMCVHMYACEYRFRCQCRCVCMHQHALTSLSKKFVCVHMYLDVSGGVCVCIRGCVCMHQEVRACWCIVDEVRACWCINTPSPLSRKFVYTHARMHTNVRTCKQMRTHAHTCKHMHRHMRAHMYTHSHRHTHVHICTHLSFHRAVEPLNRTQRPSNTPQTRRFPIIVSFEGKETSISIFLFFNNTHSYVGKIRCLVNTQSS